MRIPQINRSLIAVVSIGVAFSGFAYFYLIRPPAPFCWDEAHHSTFSLLIAKSIRDGNCSAFWHYTRTQIYWPFLHSWVSAVFLIMGGYSYQSARFTNVVIGFFSILLICQVGKKLGGEQGRPVGVAAVVLLVLCPMFLALSATAMIENLGLMIVLILIWLQFVAWEKGKRGYFFAGGVGLALLYLTKYIYALFFGVALICFWISLLCGKAEEINKKIVLVKSWWVLPGFLLVWGTWMLMGPAAEKFNMLLYRIKDTGGWNPFGYTKLENRLFFLRALLYAYTFSIGIYLLYLGGFLYAFFQIKKAKLRFLLLVFLANYIPMSFIRNSQERFIYVSVPALFLLTASFLGWVSSKLSPQKRRVAAVLVSLLILGDVPKLPRYVRQVGNATLSVCLFTTENQFNYSTLFGLAAYPRFLRFPKEFFNPRAETKTPVHNTEDVLNFVWENTDPRAPICAPFYLGTLSPHLWQWHAIIKNRPLATSWNPSCYYFISLEVDADSPYYRLGNVHLIEGRTGEWDAFMKELQKQGLMRVVKEKYFGDIGLRITISVKNVGADNPIWQRIRLP